MARNEQMIQNRIKLIEKIVGWMELKKPESEIKLNLGANDDNQEYIASILREAKRELDKKQGIKQRGQEPEGSTREDWRREEQYKYETAQKKKEDAKPLLTKMAKKIKSVVKTEVSEAERNATGRKELMSHIRVAQKTGWDEDYSSHPKKPKK